MCGFVAAIRFDGSDPAPVVRALTGSLYHRGPNGEGHHDDSHVAIGFRRLSIVDPPGGDQPFWSPDGTVVLVGNGEIYNAPELRLELQRRGHEFRSLSDIEVALKLYLADGEAGFRRLRGMFALVIWDQRSGDLLVVRDPFGIKPAMYQRTHDGVMVASELPTLLAAPGASRVIDPAALGRSLTFQFVPPPATLVAGIQEVMPGHLLRVNQNGRISVERWNELTFEPQEGTYDEQRRQIRRALEDSVRVHLRSDVPVGSLLSSGIDSTAIAALAAQHGPLPTFTVGVEGAIDELSRAKVAAAEMGLPHYGRYLGPSDIFDDLPTVVSHLGPVADPAAVALYHVAELARQHVTVVLSGEGADELFGGYRVYRQPIAARPVSGLPYAVRRHVWTKASRLPEGTKGRAYLMRGSAGPISWYRGGAQIATEEIRLELMKDPDAWTWDGPEKVLEPSWARSRHLDPVTRMQTVDLDVWLPGDILAKADRVTMAHSLELRVPFLDPVVWQVARRLPLHSRINRRTTKWLMRQAVADLVPPSVLNRPKLGFPVPVGVWLRGERGEGLAASVLDTAVGEHLKPEVVHRLEREHRAGEADHGRLLWALHVFATWSDAVLTGTKTVEPVAA
jgi:asparagine synthase (glutamine-hydrolysing)